LAAKVIAENAAQGTLSKAEERAALLATAQEALANEEAKSAESLRKVTALNEQVAALRGQLGSLQALLDEAASKDQAAQVRIDSLGTNLNVALARAAAEQKKRAELEEAERKRLEAEAKALQAETVQLEKYRSEFFGRMRDVLGNREGVRVVGDRFVFSSEVLFEPASADLSPGGKAQIAEVATLLKQVSGEIPPGIDWILRVDGHTDATPLSGQGRYRNNWELSQGRALSVVEYMINDLGFPAERLAATGFGEFQPVASDDTPEALAQNRRIELKLTER
jgi:chemotaxis protein MotB